MNDLTKENYEILAKKREYGLNLAMAYVKNLKEQLYDRYKRDVIESIKSRIKTFESAIGKCDARGIKKNLRDINDNMKDIAGMRIICLFEDDIYLVLEELRKMPVLMMVCQQKDYVKEPKENGYRSLHLIVDIPTPTLDEAPVLAPIEIQIRDKAMDLWASLEHPIRYKNDTPDPKAIKQFAQAAKGLANFSKTAIECRDYKSKKQNS